MIKTTRLIIGLSAAFTLLVGWFAWSTLHTSPRLAAENLRGAALAMTVAIEKLAAADPSFVSLARFTPEDLSYFSLVDSAGMIRFHTNPALISQRVEREQEKLPTAGFSEGRDLLGTGEEVYLLRSTIHPDQEVYSLTLALHTYRADQVIRRARTGVTIAATLTASIWALTLLLLFAQRREERHRQEMRRRQELARLGEMGAVMAHEIRNPLAGIKGFAQLVQRSENLEQTRQYADIIIAQSLRMEGLVNDLLNFTREEMRERQEIDLATLIQECIELITIEAEAARIKVEQKTSPLTSRIVADRIRQLLLNLIKNSLQAMPEGGLLRISLEQKGKTARIIVADNGKGIAVQDLDLIFEPFWTNKVHGSGLGLALCRKIAEEHGGSLKIESTLGAGTIAILVLPMVA